MATAKGNPLKDLSVISLSGRSCQNGVRLSRAVRLGLTVCLLALATLAVAYEPAAVDSSLQVGEVRLRQDDIFTDEEVATATGLNGLLRRSMNSFHADTRPWVIRKELLFDTGQVYRPDLLAESERNLRGLGFLNNVAVVATDTTADGRVNVDVRTRETWTLSTEFSFALAGDGEVRWVTSVADKNFLGYGFELRGVAGHELDADYGRAYVKLNRSFGTPLTLLMSLDERSDGHERNLRVYLPFRADDQWWSAGVQLWDQRRNVRWYLSNGGSAGADPGSEERLYTLLPREKTGMQLDIMRRVGRRESRRVWRVGAGLGIMSLDYRVAGSGQVLSDGRVQDLSCLAAPGGAMAREAGTTVWPYLILSSKSRRWVKTRFLLRYGNQEDVLLDPSFALMAGPAGSMVGSTSGDANRVRMEGEFQNWSRWGRSFLVQRLSAEAVLGNSRDRSHRLDAVLGTHLRIGPEVQPFTLKTYVEGIHSEGLRGDMLPVLGLDRGLRSLGLDGMAGPRLLRWSAELGRGIGWSPLDLARLGWGLYYGGGIAQWADEDRDLSDARHEAGVGLRMGFTRSGNSPVARVDFTRDLSGSEGWVLTTVTGGYF